LRDADDAIRPFLAPAIAIAAGLAAAVWLLDLIPPKELTFAAGREDGAYHAMAEKYQAILARDGIEMTILETAGSVDNMAALETGAADVGFIQGGIQPPEGAPISALAATFLEPFWFFHSAAFENPSNPTGWNGLRIAIGEPGGGTRFAVEEVLSALDLENVVFEAVPLGGADAASALLAGQVDAALFVAPIDAPYLQPLFESGAPVIGSIRDGEALARRLPYIQLAHIPPAGLDYGARVPPRRIDLIAMVGRLVSRDDLHPSLVDRLVNAAREIHSGRGLLQNEDQFPTAQGVTMRMNPQALSLLESAPSPLGLILPYWITAQISKFALLLLPALFLLLPLIKLGPWVYQWRMSARVWRHYGDLLDIDREVLDATDPARLGTLRTKLDAIERDLIGLKLPLRFRDRAYTMRLHIQMVRDRIGRLLADA
jgi:TRAP-type uncharacterized transport system substrate-binding protein